MEFTVKKENLVRELDFAARIAERRGTVPILQSVLLSATDEGVSITATDLELAIQCECEAEVNVKGAIAIPGKRLLDYVKALPAGDIKFKTGDNGWANISCGRARTRIPAQDREAFPELPDIPEEFLDISAKNVSRGIGLTQFAISTEETRFTLKGALLNIKDDAMQIVATDGCRLAYYESQSGCKEGALSGLIPTKAADIVKRMVDASDIEPLRLGQDDRRFFFWLAGRRLIAQRIEGYFPDYERVLPREHAHTITIDRKNLLASIERAIGFADERAKSVSLEFGEGALKIKGESETGETVEELGVLFTGEPARIIFNGSYLTQALKLLTGSYVEFSFTDESKAAEITSQETPGYRYIVMPIRG